MATVSFADLMGGAYALARAHYRPLSLPCYEAEPGFDEDEPDLAPQRR